MCSDGYWQTPQRTKAAKQRGQKSYCVDLFEPILMTVRSSRCLMFDQKTLQSLERILNESGDLKTYLGVPEILSRRSRGSSSAGAFQHVSRSMMPSDWCSDLHFCFRLNSDRQRDQWTDAYLTLSVFLCLVVRKYVWEWKSVYYECMWGKRKDRNILL